MIKSGSTLIVFLKVLILKIALTQIMQLLLSVLNFLRYSGGFQRKHTNHVLFYASLVVTELVLVKSPP
jgi:hypothetical protein